MANAPPPNPTTPQFDSEFSSEQDIFYFHHVIDAQTATLQSQVLGPNLSNTFCHPRATTFCTPSHIHDVLVRKTTGFLALLQPGTSPSRTRTILAWAESGHGHHPHGDLLDAKASVLSNKRWTSQVIRIANEMGVNMGHPYDRRACGGTAGMFRASHVEVKLAVHAAFILLRMAGIPTDCVTRAHLRKLRGKAWSGGARPRFEIYFSKRNCRGCAQFVRRLEEDTGAEIKLYWKERLVAIDYGKCRMGPMQSPQGEVVLVEEDEEDEEEEEDVNEMQMVDLTDGTDDHVSREVSQAVEVVEVTPEPLGAYVNGLAYCVGQRGDQGRVVRAVVGLAKIWKRQTAMGTNVRRQHQNRGGEERGDEERTTETRPLLATPPALNIPMQGQGTTSS